MLSSLPLLMQPQVPDTLSSLLHKLGASWGTGQFYRGAETALSLFWAGAQRLSYALHQVPWCLCGSPGLGCGQLCYNQGLLKPDPGMLCTLQSRRIHTSHANPLTFRAESDTPESSRALGKGQNLASKIDGEFFHRFLQKQLWYLWHPVSSTQARASSLKSTTFLSKPNK